MYMKQLQPRFTVYNGFRETACFYSYLPSVNQTECPSLLLSLLWCWYRPLWLRVRLKCQTFYHQWRIQRGRRKRSPPLKRERERGGGVRTRKDVVFGKWNSLEKERFAFPPDCVHYVQNEVQYYYFYFEDLFSKRVDLVPNVMHFEKCFPSAKCVVTAPLQHKCLDPPPPPSL